MSVLLEKGVEPDTVAEGNRTPLMECAVNGHLECCQELLRSSPAGSKLATDATDSHGANALACAAFGGNIACFKVS